MSEKVTKFCDDFKKNKNFKQVFHENFIISAEQLKVFCEIWDKNCAVWNATVAYIYVGGENRINSWKK